MTSSPELAKSFGLNEEEFERFRAKLGRMPAREELAVCGALWSEHCSYKSSKVHLRRFHTKEDWVWQGPGENAGVIQVAGDWGVAFKMESHNHPSYIEPYQGAATGVGGILRDVFCMGARPIAMLNCLRFGEGTWNAHLLKETVRGIADYGNSVGVPTLTGQTSFHPGYSENILVNAFALGVIHKDKIFRGVAGAKGAAAESPDLCAVLPGTPVDAALDAALFPEDGNLLVYFGSATGRDGVHGATMSSAEFSRSGASLKPTVQVGDPFAEKVVLECTLELLESGLVYGLQDMGAAGLTSSSVEMAGRSGLGVAIDLNLVPQRARNMQPWELLLSESQERMVAAVEPRNRQGVEAILAKYGLSSAVIGRVNRSGRFACTFDGALCVNLPVELLVDDIPLYEWPLAAREETGAATRVAGSLPSGGDAATAGEHGRKSLGLGCDAPAGALSLIAEDAPFSLLLERIPDFAAKLLAHPLFASRAPLAAHYCATVQGNTIAASGAMRVAAAGVVRMPAETGLQHMGIAVAGGCEERWVEAAPLAGTVHSALKVARKIFAVGGLPRAMTDCLNFGSPRQKRVMRQFSDACDGLNEVAKGLAIPVVSGNVSLNNQTTDAPIPPTPMLGMVGVVDDVTAVPAAALPQTWRARGAQALDLFWIGTEWGLAHSSWEASLVSCLWGATPQAPPAYDLVLEARLGALVRGLVLELRPLLCVPVGSGGIALTALRLAAESDALLEWAPAAMDFPARRLLAEGNMGYLLALEPRAGAHADSVRLAELCGRERAFAKPIAVLKTRAAQGPSTSSPDTSHAAWRTGLVPFFQGEGA